MSTAPCPSYQINVQFLSELPPTLKAKYICLFCLNHSLKNFVCACIAVYACMRVACVCLCVCVPCVWCMHMCRSKRRTSGSLFCCSPPYSVKERFLTGPGARLAGTSQGWILQSLSSTLLGLYLLMPSFSHGCGGT